MIDDIIVFLVAIKMINDNPINKYRQINNWLKYKEAIHASLTSLAKMLRPVVDTPHVGYKWDCYQLKWREPVHHELTSLAIEMYLDL